MINSFVKYIRGSIDELRKVTWPTREETIQYSVVVIVVVLISVGFLAILDYGLAKVINALLIP
jgi:preprotein translocase subunit SecE